MMIIRIWTYRPRGGRPIPRGKRSLLEETMLSDVDFHDSPRDKDTSLIHSEFWEI